MPAEIKNLPDGLTVVPAWDAMEHWALQGLDLESLKALRVMLDLVEIVPIKYPNGQRGWYVIPEGDERERILAKLDFIHNVSAPAPESQGQLH